MAITKVTNSLVSVNAIHGTLIADNAITSVHIAQNQVTSVQIPDSSITSTQLAANSVDTAELISGSIDAIHLASDSVTTAKILDANVTTAKIANNAITSALIPDGSITDTQLGSGAFTVGTITTTGAIRGPASLTIDPAAVGDNTGTVVIAGNLQVDGTTTTINSTQLAVTDLNITVASGAASASAANNAGLTIAGAGATILYQSSGDEFRFNKPLYATHSYKTGTGATFVGQLTNSSGKLRLQSDSNRDIEIGDTNNAGIISVDTSAQSTTFSGTVRANSWYKGASDTNTLYSDTSQGTIIQTPSNSNDAAGTLYIRDSLGTVHFSLNTNTNASSFHGGTISSGAITSTGDLLINESGNTERSVRIQNSSATGFFGIEGSSANRFIGSSANNMFLGTTTADGIEFATANTVRATINSSGKVGIGTTSIDNNAKLHIEDTAYPIINLDRSSSLTTGNHLGYINFQNNGDVYGYMGAWVESASGTDGKLMFGTQNGTSLTDKMTLNSTGHLTLLPASGFSGLNNSLLGSSNGYMYAMGGTAGLYLADNSDLSNAIGIRNANYIDFTTSGSSILKFDGDGIHFQKADGQKISAKESIIMQVDADNNTASRVFQVLHGNGKTLLNLHDDYRTEVGTLQYSSTRSAGASQSNGLGASAGDWVDIAAVPYGRNIATIKIFWDAIYAPSSSHHGNMEFDIGSHYGTSYYYGWDTYINLKASSAHNSFFISEARIITPNGSGATGHFQVKFGKATGTQGTLRAYVTHRDEQCSIDPITPVVNNSRSGTTLATIKLDNRPALATSRDFTTTGKIRASAQPAFFATLSSALTAPSNLNSDIVFNTEVLDQGGCYSGSNGRFTAPCDGVYSFGINILVYPHTNGVLTPWFYKNGSAYGSTTQQGHEGSSHTGVIRQTIIKLDAGDYVTVRMSLGGGNSGANIYGGQSSFHGHMIG